MADARAQAQTNLIIEDLKGVGVYPDNWSESGSDVQYMYREGSVLVRDRDEQRVTNKLREILGASGGENEATPSGTQESGPTVHPVRVIEGLVRLEFSALSGSTPTTPEVLDQLDTEFGLGVARPDHLLSLCVHPCPATEPEEVPPGTVDPFPPPLADRGCDCDHHQCSAQRGAGSGVFVSIVDTGLVPDAALDHTWLHDVDGDIEDPYLSKPALRSYAAHGTFVAGCLRCTAPDASVYVDRAGLSAGATYETNVVPELAQALGRSPDIVVFTAATETRLELSLLGFDALYESVIRHRKGLAFVVPADNDGTRALRWPAAYPWTISVGALSANWRTRAHFSNYGGWVDVYAPGEGLVNAFAKGDFECIEPPNQGVVRRYDGMARWSGTSFSTPLVAGMIAARMSATGENANQAAKALLRIARRDAIPGVGPVLLPDDAGCVCPGSRRRGDRSCHHSRHHSCHQCS